LADRPDDQRLGINSSALFFGRYAAIAIAMFYLGTFALLVVLGNVQGLSVGYWIALGISAVLWGKQSTALRQDPLPVKQYAQFFRQNVTIGFILLLGMIVGTLLP
jgi:4-hydroxybenzoate polyprenyltransferase